MISKLSFKVECKLFGCRWKEAHPTQKIRYAATIGEGSWHIWGPEEVQRIQGQGGISFRMMQTVGEGQIPPTLHPSWVLMVGLILKIKLTWDRLTRGEETKFDSYTRSHRSET